MRLLGIVFLVAGLCIIAAGAVVLNVVSSKMDWLPADYWHEDTFEGTHRVLDRDTGAIEDSPVIVERLREVTVTDGDKAFVTETTTTFYPSDQIVTDFPAVEVELLVDRDSRLFLPGGRPQFITHDEYHYGYLTFPPDVRRDAEYAIWVPEVRDALSASFSGSTEIDGLEVYRFVTDVTDVRVWSDWDGYPSRTADAHIEYLVESRSGLVVDEVSQITIYIIDPQEGKRVAFDSDISLTDESVTENVARGKVDRFKLRVLGSYLPWLIMGLGMLFGLYGIVLIGFDRWQRRGTSVEHSRGET